MASMDDLIATISGTLHAGPQGNDLRDLQATLAQTLNPVPHPHYRPIPPPGATAIPSNGGSLPPPAPASSWNTPPPNTGFLFSSSPTPKSFARAGAGGGASSSSPGRPGGTGDGTTKYEQYHQQGFSSVPLPNGPTKPIQESSEEEGQDERPYHASVLPIKASPKDTGGFTDDAFKPLWNEKERNQWGGFKQNGNGT
ncbi:hypothetical protein CI109_102883 [Kwoniella shandongensis]|uniref:Uncharacterized protein n=1 Tax=Kwoniella shandongensis TaxID=1734106 RepID=A0A5M6C8A7_9TREE|nr:uncharacterized protein CI109_000073 [Kwoniella shandongensis]KAA5531233.1 hypothetical protein CI109_000073 [Kwoniella shandongensis]